MSERERWIIYPLLFFALGAAVRDKLFQIVEAKEIYCQSLRIVDPRDPQRFLAELGGQPNPQLGGDAQLGVLRVDEVLCEGVNIADRKNPSQVLVVLGTATLPRMSDEETETRVGTIFLKDTQGNQLSELRADQFIGGRVVTNQLLVIDPVNRYPRFIATTQPVTADLGDGTQSNLDFEGVLVLNNRVLSSHRPRASTGSATPAAEESN